MVLAIVCVIVFIIGFYIGRHIKPKKKNKKIVQLSELKVGSVLVDRSNYDYYIITKVEGSTVKIYDYVKLTISNHKIKWIGSNIDRRIHCYETLLDKYLLTNNKVLLDKLNPFIKAIEIAASHTSSEYYIRDRFGGYGIVLEPNTEDKGNFFILFLIYKGLYIDTSSDTILRYCYDSEITETKKDLLETSEEFLNIYKLLC